MKASFQSQKLIQIKYIKIESKTKITTWAVHIYFRLQNHTHFTPRGRIGQLSKKKRELRLSIILLLNWLSCQLRCCDLWWGWEGEGVGRLVSLWTLLFYLQATGLLPQIKGQWSQKRFQTSNKQTNVTFFAKQCR